MKTSSWAYGIGWLLLSSYVALGAEPASRPANWPAGLPTVQEMMAAKTDLWGEAALRQPDGPSYEFFAPLVPPLRYVNTEFKHYPVVLAPPRSLHKPRWVGNGSGVNLWASSKPMWREPGVPFAFLVGGDREPFGQAPERTTEPQFERGYLPIVQITYGDGSGTWRQEAFASVTGALAERSAVLVQFAREGSPSELAVKIDAEGVKASEGALRDKDGKLLALFEPAWKWSEEKRELVAEIGPQQPAALAIMTGLNSEPLAGGDVMPVYAEQRKACIDKWEDLLARTGVQLEVPEPIVSRAWRASVIANLMIARGDWMCYSAGNAYDHLYAGETGDAIKGLLLFGFAQDARDYMGPLLDFERKAVRFQSEGLKLQHLAAYYWLTRDADLVRRRRDAWMKAVDMYFSSREADTGLMPRQNYCGDIPKQVYPLTANANAWRGLRDLSTVLVEIGEREQADKIAAFARDYRQSIIKAVEKSEFRDTRPPFIPNALFGEQQPDDMITSTQLGSYWDLVAPYIIGSGVLEPGSEREDWLLGYLEQHGGIRMGLIAVEPHKGISAEQPGINPLYGLRYTLTLLRRDEHAKALVGFYAMLAHGFTRNTFIGAEGNRFVQGDARGRFFYLPPNSTSNAYFLHMLRYLLIQDWDLDDDGRPETLRLLYGVPSRWVADGAAIRFKNAPTMFGKMSLEVRCDLKAGKLAITVALPEQQPAKVLLRPPTPKGWRVQGVRLAGDSLQAPDGAVDLTGRTGELHVEYELARE